MIYRLVFTLIFSFFTQVGWSLNYTECSYQAIQRLDLDSDKFVERHNYYRQKLGIAAVKWNEELAEYAAQWAKRLALRCELKHRSTHEYGENIYYFSGKADEFQVVDYWAEEEKYFNHKKPIYDKKRGKLYGHYSQVIWANSTDIGAAAYQCKNGGQIWVCNYNPPGNWIGKRVY